MKHSPITASRPSRDVLSFALDRPAVARKLRPMVSEAVQFVRAYMIAAVSRPLRWREALTVGAILLAIGTAYCQVYCLLALQQMHGASMPVRASLSRVWCDIAPALLALEVGKRALRFSRVFRWPALVTTFIGADALGLLFRLQVHAMSFQLTPRRMAVDRVPFLLIAAGLLAYHELKVRRGSGVLERSVQMPDEAQFPPAQAIDWVRAAGNYVEIRIAGRTRLHRMTLRQARGILPDDLFLQIHRSVIVNRGRIAGINGRRSVVMADGTTFPVGDAHRANLPHS